MSEQDIIAAERRWGGIVAVTVGIIFAVITVTSLAMALNPPSHVETIDPNTLHLGEFAEANLGTTVGADGAIVTRIVATQFLFEPRCVAVPEGKTVTFRLSSPDVIHGLIVAGTNINTMVVPGYVSEIHAALRKAGDYRMPCHEFCGIGHSEMWAIVRVVPTAQWQPDEHGKVSCAAPG